jgi:hypothetical protein
MRAEGAAMDTVDIPLEIGSIKQTDRTQAISLRHEALQITAVTCN